MGFWKGFRSRRIKRGFKPFKRRRRIRRHVIPRALQPRTKLIKAHCVKYLSVTGTNGACSTVLIQQNSIDDTFLTLGTNQILGYDQWKALYKKAMVISSRVLVMAHNSGSTSIVAGITAVPPNQGGTPLTTYEHYMETPNTTYKLLSPDVDRANIVAQISTKRLLSLTNYKDNKQYIEIDLANETPPTTLGQWHIWAQPQDQATTGTLQMTIKVTYIVLLYDPIIPARSVES